jgi:hypothetical protein
VPVPEVADTKHVLEREEPSLVDAEVRLIDAGPGPGE